MHALFVSDTAGDFSVLVSATRDAIELVRPIFADLTSPSSGVQLAAAMCVVTVVSRNSKSVGQSITTAQVELIGSLSTTRSTVWSLRIILLPVVPNLAPVVAKLGFLTSHQMVDLLLT